MPLILSTFRRNIGRRFDTFDIRDKWNCRSQEPCGTYDTGLPVAGGAKYLMRFSPIGENVGGVATDANRNWITPYQDIIIIFNTKCQDAALAPGDVATGHTINYAGVPQTTKYQSGSGTAMWILRIPVLATATDVITYSYSQAAGNTTAVDDGQEIATVIDIPIRNYLTKRIRFTLKKSDNTAANAETIKLSIYSYASGVVTADTWMTRTFKIITTTDTDGLVDVEFTGPDAGAATVYVAAIRTNAAPSESFIWTDTIK